MLRVIYGFTLGSTSQTSQTFLNDFALVWNWTKIVDENDNVVAQQALWSDRTINVKELWFGENHYFEISGNTITACGLEMPTNGLSNYRFVVTDTAAAAFWNISNSVACMAIGETISNKTGTHGTGVIFTYSTGSCSDSISGGSGTSYIAAPGSYNNSTYAIQLVPYADAESYDTFVDIKRVVLRKPTDGGETKIGSEHFYIIDKIALPYTIE